MRRKTTATALLLSLAIAAPVLATTENVGGGYWNYGSVYSPPLGKHVYSQYTHNSATHTAYAWCGSDSKIIQKPAGQTADANAYCATWDSGSVSWSVP